MAKAIDANRLEYQKAFFGAWPKIDVHHDQDMLWSISELPSPRFNGVMGANLASDKIENTIEAVIERYSARNLPISWVEGPLSSPASLGEHLQAHGFVFEGRFPGMSIDLMELSADLKTPPGLVVKRVLDTETLEAWGNVFAEGYDIPDHAREVWLDQLFTVGMSNKSLIYHYIALLDGVPVASSSLVPGAGVVGIYNMATLKEVRRQGIGAAVTMAPLIEARDAGYHVGGLGASDLGVLLYKHMGFEQCHNIDMYIYKKES